MSGHDTIDKKKLFNETKNNNVKAVQKLRKQLQISTSFFVNRAPFDFSDAFNNSCATEVVSKKLKMNMRQKHQI